MNNQQQIHRQDDWYAFYEGKTYLRRNSFEYLWSYLFRLCMQPEAAEIITFIGDGLKFRIVDFQTLSLLYYYPNDRFALTNQQIKNLFKNAICKNQAIMNCWADNNDIYDFAPLREEQLCSMAGMSMADLLNYAYCVRPLD